MPDNSFEKKVRDRLDEFGLSPTNNVWEQVEAHLNRKKKRDRGIIWFLFAAMLLGAGGFYFYESSDSSSAKDTPEIAQVSGAKDKETSQQNINNGNQNSKETGEEAGRGNAQNSDQKEVSASSINKSDLKEKQAKSNNNKNKARSFGISDVPDGTIAGKRNTDEAANNSEINNSLLQAEKNEKGRLDNNGQKDQAAESDETTTKEIETTERKSGPDSLSDQKTAQVQTKAKDSKKEKKIALQKKQGWQFGLTLNGGATALPKRLLNSPQKSLLADNLASPGIPAAPPVYPYSQEQSYGWGIGSWVRRDLNKRIALSAGLQYQYYSTSAKTGFQSSGPVMVYNGYQSVALSSYYLPGSLTEYRNRYHTLQIPLEFRITWGKQKALPFSLIAGLQPGFLIGSNALLKDSSGILYSDKTNFNKFQLGFNTGLQLRLFNKSKMPLDIGPVFQYQLTNAFRKNTDYTGHLMFFGLQADWQLFKLQPKQR